MQPGLPVHVDADQQVGGVGGGLDQVRAAEVGAGLGERGDGQPVPGGDDLVVPPRPRPLRARRQQPLLDGDHPRGVHQALDVGELEDRGALFERALLGDAEISGGELGVLLPQYGAQLLRRPYVVRALGVPARTVVAVRVQRGGEAALFGAQFADHEVGGLDGDPTGQVRAGGPPQVGVGPAQQGVVVEHLLEVRHGPVRVHRIARESAAELVVDAAAGHRRAGRLRHFQGRRGAGARVVTEQEFQRHGRRELGRAAESAVHRVEFAGQAHQGGVQLLGARRPPVRGQRLGQRPSRQVGDDPAGDLADLVAAVRPGAAYPFQDLPEGRHAVTGLGREVGAEVEGLGVGGEEDGHRPAALAGGGLHGLHVDGVDVRALLAIHLDGHEVFVEQLGGGLVLEAFVGHHMTPVARAVADAEQHRHTAPPGFLERIGGPGPPVDRVVGVLKQIRGSLMSQAVRHGSILSQRGSVSRERRELSTGLPEFVRTRNTVRTATITAGDCWNCWRGMACRAHWLCCATATGRKRKRC